MNAPETLTLPPTETLYNEILQAYRHFNRTLFEAKLPECLFSLQRKKGRLAMVSMDRFVRVDGTVFTHEISVNPAYFAAATPREFLSNLVHEMCRIKINVGSQPDERRSKGYHCKDWGKEMENVGLMPSHDGSVTGNKYGYKMTHYVVENGMFDRAANALLQRGWKLTWLDRQAEPFDPSLMSDADFREDGDPEGTEDESESDPYAATDEERFSAAVSDATNAGGETDDGNPLSPSTLDAASIFSSTGTPSRRNTVGAQLPRPPTQLGKPLAAKLNERPATHLGSALIAPKVSKAGKKYKYECPKCLAAVWGKLELNLICGACNKPMPHVPPGANETEEGGES